MRESKVKEWAKALETVLTKLYDDTTAAYSYSPGSAHSFNRAAIINCLVMRPKGMFISFETQEKPSSITDWKINTEIHLKRKKNPLT